MQTLYHILILATKEKEGEEDTIQFIYGGIAHRTFEKDCHKKRYYIIAV
jgi:hypothetical protein